MYATTVCKRIGFTPRWYVKSKTLLENGSRFWGRQADPQLNQVGVYPQLLKF
jgi:hypothetical protein